MSYTWGDFKNKVKQLLSDGAVNNDSAVAAVAEYVRAHFYKDFTKNLELYKVHYVNYQSERKRLLGWNITLSTSDLEMQVRAQLTDSSINEDVAIRAIAEFVMGQIDKDLRGNLEGHKVHASDYLVLRNRLLGHAVMLDDATLKTRVKELLTDVTPSDTTAIQAVAEYVKYKISREVNHDPELSGSYLKTYFGQKIKLLGYSISIGSVALRTAVNPLITVDANRLGVSDPDGFVDKCIAEAVADIAGFDTYLTSQIAQAKADLAGVANYINSKIALAKADLAAYGTMLENVMRQAVIDLQSHIIPYRSGHETVYTVDDVSAEGATSHGNLPEACQIRDAYFVTVKDDEVCIPGPVDLYDWGKRFNLINGDECINDGTFYLCLDPESATFLVYPALDANHRLSIFWDGLKLDFADADQTPFDEPMALAVAEYVQNGKLSQEYISSRRRLLLDAKDRGRMRYG